MLNESNEPIPGGIEPLIEPSGLQAVRFAKCIGCPDMGMECLGGNLVMLSLSELKKWAKMWKDHYKLSIEACAEIWKIGVSSAKRFLNPMEKDIRYTTIQCIVRGIVGYGFPADKEFGDNPCPGTSAEINARIAVLEKQYEEKREECEHLLARKNANANEYIERTAELREGYEKQLAHKEDTISFLKDLSEKLQKDLGKSEAISSNYLSRIDVKNQQLLEAYAEIRQLHTEMLKIVNTNADELKAMIDRFLRLTEAHTAEVNALTKNGQA